MSRNSTSKCFLEIEIAGRNLGRLTFSLYSDVCPKTCKNFKCLCTGERGFSSKFDKALHFKNSTFHRVVKGFMIQGGDFTSGDGKGGESIFGGPFEDENLTLKHDKPYLLSMANRGKDTNRSQFFITTAPASHLDGVHVIFGELIDGFDIVREIENQPVDGKSRPINKIIIVDCGEPKQDSLEKNQNNDGDKLREISERSYNKNKERLLPKKYSSRRDSMSPSPKRRSYLQSRSRSLSTSSSSSSSSASSSSSSASSSASSSSSSSSSVSSRSSSASSSLSSSDSSADSSPSISGSTSSGDSSTSGVSHSKRSSSSSCTSSSSKARSKRRDREEGANPRRNSEDDDSDVVIQEKTSINNKNVEDGRDYPCSVKPEEIPQVPLNKFLFRPIVKISDENVNKDEEEPIEEDADLSRYKDKSSDNDETTNDTNNNNNSKSISSSVATVEKSTRVSRSGRTMKGRGSFKFRTPSPDSRRMKSYHSRQRRSRSPHYSRRRDERDSRRDSSHRYDRSR